MANVDSLIYQYLNQIPEGPTKVAIEHLYDILRQTRTRTGGDSDLVSSTASASSTNFYAGSLLEETQNLSMFSVPEDDPTETFTTSTDITLTRDSVVVATAALTVTLNPNPSENEHVSVKRSGSGVVVIDGNGNTLDGESTFSLLYNHESIDVLYINDGWFIV